MKKIIQVLLAINCFAMFSQQVIVEEKFEKDNVPLGYENLSFKNQIAIQKGKHYSISKNREVNKITTFDTQGKEKVWFENRTLMNPSFNYSGNILVADEYSKLKLEGKSFNVFSNNDESFTFDIKNKGAFYFDAFMFKFKEKNNTIINYKDKSVKKSTFGLKNDYLEALKSFSGDNFYKSQRAPGIKHFINKKGNIEVISKSVSKNCKESKIYRKEYSALGELLTEIQYDILLKDQSLILSVTDGGMMMQKFVGGFSNTQTNYAGFSQTTSIGPSTYVDFMDDGSVNNLFFDNSENVYVYGMFGEKDKENLLYNRIQGYYIYKFDKLGKLVWEKKFETDKLDKIRVAYLNNTYVRMFNMNGQLQFLFASTQPDEVLMLSDINETNGDFIKSDFLTFKTDSSNDFRDFIFSNITNKESLKNKIMDYETLMMYHKNKEFKKYIDLTNSKNKVFFNTLINNEGSWLVESDNSTYYKVTYF